ncbi:MAG: undecaprenyl-phosphate glucose phosphotransferase [Hyphomicrobium sp.]
MSVHTVSEPSVAVAAATACREKHGRSPIQRWSRVVAADLVAIYDIFAVLAGSVVPAAIYSRVGGVVADWALLAQTSLAACIITYLCLRNMGMYDTARMHDFPRAPSKLFTALAIGLVGTLGLGLPSAIRNGHALVWLATWLSASFTIILLFRGLAHRVLKRMTAAGYFDHRIAVFGAGAIARRVRDHLANPALGIRFTGVYDDRMGEDRVNPEGLKVAGRLDDLITAARDGHIDQIVIALPQSADRRIAAVARKLEPLPVSVHIVTHIASDLVDEGPAYKVSNIGSVGMLDVKKKALSDWGPFVKRMEDIVLGIVFSAITAVLYPFIALAIRAESKGPVLFRQRRRGLNHKIIDIIKFRTMHVLEDDAEVRQATPDDVRVTRVGRFLRRTSLDELPQLWNVLKGEMSLVGPRPHALVHDEQFGEMLESYANRHEVKPGITGLAQVSGLRGETSGAGSVEARVNADIAYIKTWSLGLDLKILAQTLVAMVTGKNAH